MNYNDDKIQQQIEAYLNQDMSDLDRSRFEKMIHDDAELHEEVEMQESVLEAIRQERAFMLKAGLNQIPVSLWSTGVMEALKIAAISIGIGVAGVGGYYLYQERNATSASVSVETTSPVSQQDAPQIQSLESEEPEGPKPVSEPIPEKSQDLDEMQHSTPQKPAISTQKVKVADKSRSVENRPNILTEESAIREPGTKAIQAPASKEVTLPNDGISQKSSLESVHPEVVIKRDNKDKFHYQFSDSKLVLYADFSDKLYEVLELNQSNEKQLFFSYDGKFFSLDPAQTEIAPLKEVKDKNLIQILSGYQKRKN